MLCWLVVLLVLFLGFVSLVSLGTTEVYSLVPLEVTATLVFGLAPIFTACIATRNPMRASRIALCLTPFAFLFMNRLPLYSFYFPVRLIAAMATTLLPGLLWLFAARGNWPLPLSTEVFARRRSLSVIAVISLAFFMLASSVACSLMLPWWPLVGDCGSRPLLDDNGQPRSIDFTARILYVGPKTRSGYSLFSVARVEERFSASIWAIPKIVILRDFFRSTDRGEYFFIEGRRSLGPFTRFLPVVERVECGHSSHLRDATVALKILHDGPPRTGVRIIGAVLASRWKNPRPLPGIEVLIKGPSGTTTAVTDDQGVYDVSGLPFGRYSVEVLTKEWHPVCDLNLEKQAIDGCSLFLDEVRQQDKL